MDVDVLTEVVIDRPVADVAAFSGDPDNAPLWYVNIKKVECQTPRPLRAGSRVTFVAQFLGRKLVYTYEFVELADGQHLVMCTSQGPFPMETTYTWQALPDGKARMTLRNRGTPSGFSRLIAPFMARAMRRANQKDLERLKRLLEG